MIDKIALEKELRRIKKDINSIEHEWDKKLKRDLGDIKKQVKKIDRQIH